MKKVLEKQHEEKNDEDMAREKLISQEQEIFNLRMRVEELVFKNEKLQAFQEQTPGSAAF